jgi:hypothetical protein
LYDYSTLSIVTLDPPASDWFESILAPGIGIEPAYDAEALTGGIASGSSQAGFSVELNWLGSGAPGSQIFEIYDSSYNFLESGNTVAASAAAVPEPATLMLLAAGIATIGIFHKKKVLNS